MDFLRKEIKTIRDSKIGGILFLSLTLFIAFIVAQSPLLYSAQAEKVLIPAGVTPGEYVQRIKNADVNNDGVINMFDYSIMEDVEGRQGFYAADNNSDNSVNALDSSFVISNLFTDVNEQVDTVMRDPDFAKAVQAEAVSDQNAKLPAGTLSGLSIETTQGGSGSEFGRQVIPSTLGTVSQFTGAAEYSIDFELPDGPGGFAPMLGLSYSSSAIDDGRIPSYNFSKAYAPSQFGHGFNLQGVGSISRDTKGEKNLYVVKGQQYHRFLLSLPGGMSAELVYNDSTNSWVSLPQSFLKISHQKPGKVSLNGINFVDPGEWIVTTKDGTTYYFGEEHVETRIAPSGQIIDSKDTLDKDKKKVIGSQEGNLYIEYDNAHLCTGSSDRDPCETKEEDGKVAIVTKWLLRKTVLADGKDITYTYDSYQKKLESADRGQSQYVSAASYPKLITWNDQKFRVRFDLENRSPADNILEANTEAMTKRIKDVYVEVKPRNSQAYAQLRRYNLRYTNLDIGSIKNSNKASILTGISEYGTKNDVSLAPVTFDYSQVVFQSEREPSGESIYVTSVNNGNGGHTRFVFDPYTVDPLNVQGKGIDTMYRVRVKEKQVVDTSHGQNKSYREVYNYGIPRAFVDNTRQSNDGKLYASPEFLGHSSIEVKKYDFDGDLIGKTQSKFYQANATDTCFNPHPAKGMTYEVTTFNGEQQVQNVSTTEYKYRLADKNNQPVNQACAPIFARQPYFVYTHQSKNLTSEQLGQDFVPENIKAKIQQPILSEARTLNEYEYDVFGNMTKSSTIGYVDAQWSDLDEKDNKYSYSYFLPPTQTWMLTLPYLTYGSSIPSCTKDVNDCQKGRIQYYYDNFSSQDYRAIEIDKQQPTLGLITQKETHLTKDRVIVEGYDYDRLSFLPNDNRRGNLTKKYAPKTNLTTVSDPAKEVVLVEEKNYDDYFHTQLKSQKNALGHETLTEDYDDILQLPQTNRIMIQSSPKKYFVTKMTYDQFGRPLYTFESRPDNSDSIMSVPKTVTTYYEGETGMVIRSADLRGQKDDGNFDYALKDTFFDGAGKTIQTQLLDDEVSGQSKRKTSTNIFRADGQPEQVFDVVLSDAVVIPQLDTKQISGDEALAALRSQPPAIQPLTGGRLMATTQYDGVGRPINEKEYYAKSDGASLGEYTTQKQYAANAVKTINQKGVTSVEVNDGMGRAVAGISLGRNNTEGMVVSNKFGHPLVDQPTETTFTGLDGVSTKSSFTYDDAGMLMKSRDPSLGEVSYKYDVYGNKIYERKREREDIDFIYDQLGRLTQRRYNHPGLSMFKKYGQVSTSSVKYEYDNGAYSIGKVTKSSSDIITNEFTYNASGNVLTQKEKVHDRQKTTQYTYTDAGTIKTNKMPDGSTIAYAYSGASYISGLQLDNKPLATGMVYDDGGDLIAANAAIEGGNIAFTGNYDSAGRIEKFTLAKDSNNIFQQQLAYNQFTEISRVVENQTTLPQSAYQYEYDDFSQLKKATTAKYTSSYNYDSFGRILSKNEAKQVNLTYKNTFPFFAPASATLAGEFTAGAPRGGDDPQTGLPSGPVTPRVSATITTNPDLTSTTTPLPSVPVPSTTGPVANSLIDLAASPELPPLPPTQDPTIRLTFTYDDHGNTKDDGVRCYEYNMEDQLIRLMVKKDSQKTCLDDQSDSAAKQISYFFYDDSGKPVLEERFGDGQDGSTVNTQAEPTERRYFFSGGYEEIVSRLDGTLAQSNRLYLPVFPYLVLDKTNTKVQWLVKDYMSSVRMVLNDKAEADSSLAYYPFGGTVTGNAQGDSIPKSQPGNPRSLPDDGFSQENPLEGQSIGQSISQQEVGGSNPVATDRLFSGHLKLAGTDLYHTGPRLYSPELGIFLQPDKNEGVNRYAYAFNNPVMLNDPSGKCAIVCTALLGGLLGGGMDLAAQMLIEGKSFKEVNWSSVATSAVTGAVVGAMGVGLAGQIGKAAGMVSSISQASSAQGARAVAGAVGRQAVSALKGPAGKALVKSGAKMVATAAAKGAAESVAFEYGANLLTGEQKTTREYFNTAAKGAVGGVFYMGGSVSGDVEKLVFRHIRVGLRGKINNPTVRKWGAKVMAKGLLKTNDVILDRYGYTIEKGLCVPFFCGGGASFVAIGEDVGKSVLKNGLDTGVEMLIGDNEIVGNMLKGYETVKKLAPEPAPPPAILLMGDQNPGPIAL